MTRPIHYSTAAMTDLRQMIRRAGSNGKWIKAVRLRLKLMAISQQCLQIG